MGQAWYDGLPEDAVLSETAKAYKEGEALIRDGLSRGMSFDEACNLLKEKNEDLRKGIIEDMLKVLIAEAHFGKEVPLEQLASRLSVPLDRLETAKAAMLEDVKQESIKTFYQGLGHGNA